MNMLTRAWLGLTSNEVKVRKWPWYQGFDLNFIIEIDKNAYLKISHLKSPFQLFNYLSFSFSLLVNFCFHNYMSKLEICLDFNSDILIFPLLLVNVIQAVEGPYKVPKSRKVRHVQPFYFLFGRTRLTFIFFSGQTHWGFLFLNGWMHQYFQFLSIRAISLIWLVRINICPAIE